MHLPASQYPVATRATSCVALHAPASIPNHMSLRAAFGTRILHFMRIGIALIFAYGLSGCSLYFDHGDEPQEEPNREPAPTVVDFAARCNAAEGAAISLDTSHVATTLAGRWWLCGGAAEFYGNVEFTADMHFYMLTAVNGQFVRNLGPTKSGSYSVDENPAGISFSIHQRYQDGNGATYPLQGHIEKTPRALLLGGGFYVAIP